LDLFNGNRSQQSINVLKLSFLGQNYSSCHRGLAIVHRQQGILAGSDHQTTDRSKKIVILPKSFGQPRNRIPRLSESVIVHE
jgi:hypothetical protein